MRRDIEVMLTELKAQFSVYMFRWIDTFERSNMGRCSWATTIARSWLRQLKLTQGSPSTYCTAVTWHCYCTCTNFFVSVKVARGHDLAVIWQSWLLTRTPSRITYITVLYSAFAQCTRIEGHIFKTLARYDFLRARVPVYDMRDMSGRCCRHAVREKTHYLHFAQRTNTLPSFCTKH